MLKRKLCAMTGSGTLGVENTRCVKDALCVKIVALLACSTTATLAQGAPDREMSHSLQEVVVTANKREQSLNEVGMTAAVLGADAMQQQGLHSLVDIAKRVPSLSFAAAPNGTPVYTLRGVGFYETSIGAYPSVSIYVDEVPLSFPVMTAHKTFDLERVEILKGPQGTLFGQNATGGAINYIAAKPTDTFESSVSGTYGRFDQADMEGYINGPLAEGLSARLSGRSESADGWQQSRTRRGDENGEVKNHMARLQLAYEPDDSLRILLNLNGSRDRSETQAGQHIALQFQNEGLFGTPPGAFRNPDVVATPYTRKSNRSADWSQRSFISDREVPFADNEMWQASFRLDKDIGTLGTLTSITAYSEFRQRQGNDSDGMAVNSLDVPLTIGSIDVFTQELRFANDPGNSLRYVVGVNYEMDDVFQEVNIDYSASSATIGFGQLFGYPIDVDTVTSKQEMTNVAAFGNLEFDLREDLTLKAGARYTEADNKAAICQSDPQAPYHIGNLFEFFGAFLGGPAQQPYVPGDCFTLNLDQDTFLPVVDYLPVLGRGEYEDRLKEDNISWRLGVDYRLNPDVLLYANVSKGYKAGSYPAITGSTMSQYVPATQESVLSVEGGLKSSLLDNRVQLNVAAFHYDYQDKQLRTKLNDPVFGQLDVLRNIPESTVKGVELEVTARPTPYLTVTAAYTYLNAEVDKFIGTNAGGDTGIDFGGTEIPYTPENQLALGANVNFPITDGMNLFAGVSLNYQSDTIATLGGDNNPTTINDSLVSCVYCIGSYTLVDGQLGIEASDGRWRAFLWAKNIGDRYYWTNVVSGYDTVSRFAGKPETYGLTLSYNFR